VADADASSATDERDDQSERETATDVVFVVMPFADTERPAIGVSLLQAAVRDAGYASAIEYCNIVFADEIGAELYSVVASGFTPDMLVGEWLFADEVFGDRIPPPEAFVEQVLASRAPPGFVEQVPFIRGLRDAYLDGCVATIMARRPRIVGFTTTFHQTCASLAVAKRLKELDDAPIVVFGGANCEGEMGVEMLASFGWIDCVCGGEADRSFPRLLGVLLGAEKGPIGGVLLRGDEKTAQRSMPVMDMDALPLPDYDDYFEQVDAARTVDRATTHIIVETSRGCWWGAKHHCTFCGLNGDTLTFRSKSPERAFEEITALTARHGLDRVGCVDNILDHSYIDTLFPMLAESDLELELFYEVKANLRHDQLVKLRRGGMRQIQPGIESFSNPVLKLMDKGVSGVQNVQLMRWCEELDILCSWNLLAGFPNEPASEYARMAEMLPLLVHLNPPLSCGRLRLDRFSPFHARHESYGFRRVRPARAYFYVFPLGRRAMHRLAYFFDYDYADGRVPDDYLGPVTAAIAQWTAGRMLGADAPRLDAEFEAAAIVVTDTRPVAQAPRHVLEGVSARIYELCDVAKSLPVLLRDPVLAGREDEVRAALERLLENRLMLLDDGRYASLAVFRNRRTMLTDERVEAAAAA
jgi:ribosomal peptide maturation radical SAM protein 1